MAIQLSTYQESLDFFKKATYKNDEYFLKGDIVNIPKEKVPTNAVNTFMLENLVVDQKSLGNNRAVTTIKDIAVQRFHPNNIDNKDFWAQCRKEFPLVSVCGAPSKNIKDVNAQTLQLSANIGLLPILNSILENSPKKLNVLEIGCGYGNLFFEIKDKCNYCGIDYIIHKSLKKYKNFIEIEKSGIPDFFFDMTFFDIIYSVNVLQHCSQKDRFKYFQEGYDVLKSGGLFLFTEFLMTEENQNDSCWGIVDENGRGYTQFFNQLTECDWDHELYDHFDNLGFNLIKCNIKSNFYTGIVQKQ